MIVAYNSTHSYSWLDLHYLSWSDRYRWATLLVTNWRFDWLTDEINRISVFLDSCDAATLLIEVRWRFLLGKIYGIVIFNYLEIWQRTKVTNVSLC